MAKIVDLVATEVALAWLQFDIYFAKTLEHFLQTQQMFFENAGKYDDVIKVNKAGFVSQSAEYTFHNPLEIARSVDNSKWEHFKFIESSM